MDKVSVLLSFLIPFIYLFGGFLFVAVTPPFRSRGLVYRTEKALVSEETWKYAHYSFGIVCIFMGIYLVVLTGLIDAVLWRLGASVIQSRIVCAAVMAVQFLLVLLPFFYTEQHLKDDFDEAGRQLLSGRKEFKQLKKDEQWGSWIQWKDDDWDDWDTWLQKRDLELDREREEKEKK